MATLPRVTRFLARIAQGRLVTYSIITSVAVCGFILRSIDLGRSLWQDEAWVANAAISPSLSNVLYYDAWLQTSPPLFMLLVRFTVTAFGLSNYSFRAVPLLMGLVSMAGMGMIARRMLTRGYALLAWTIFVLSPTAIMNSATLKQYSSELAASTTILLLCIRYLDRPTTKRFCLLLAASVVALFMAYSSAFVLPGIVLVVAMRSVPANGLPLSVKRRKSVALRRGFILAVVTAGVFVVEYLCFISPNTSPRLTAFWDNGEHGNIRRVAALTLDTFLRQLPIPLPPVQNKLMVALIGPFLAGGLILAWLRFRKGRSESMRIQVVCALPCLLLILGKAASAYPLSERTNLFLLPFIVLLLVCSLQFTSDFVLSKLRSDLLRRVVRIGVAAATLLTILAGIRNYSFARLNVPVEDIASAVSFLRTQAQPEDLIWVHASCSEGFKLYTKVTSWHDAPVKYGHTGWPCCPRVSAGVKSSGSREAVRNDLDASLPEGAARRIWLLYTTRVGHWSYVGLDESRVMRDILRHRGCAETATSLFCQRWRQFVRVFPPRFCPSDQCIQCH